MTDNLSGIGEAIRKASEAYAEAISIVSKALQNIGSQASGADRERLVDNWLRMARMSKDGIITAMEQGFDVKAYTWNAFLLPKGTPEPIVAKLNHGMVEAMKTPAVREKLDAVGLKLVSEERATPAYLDQFVRSEIDKWAVLIKATGISIE